MALHIDESWKEVLRSELESDYMQKLSLFLCQEEKDGKQVYPPKHLIFNAFNHTPFDKVKAVILGQDPYHGPGQAHGLAFSVQKGVTIPPSLRNIYKELKKDIPNFEIPRHGDLTKWADQGVLLLNASLTVRENSPSSHQNKGWEIFTDHAIRELAERREKIAFLLWGKNAQSKIPLIDGQKHLILKAAHPSFFSANNGFFGCRHFSRTNEYLLSLGKTPIDWQIE